MQPQHHILYDLCAWLWVGIDLHNRKSTVGVWVNAYDHRWALGKTKLACTPECRGFDWRDIEKRAWKACMKYTSMLSHLTQLWALGMA